MITRTYHIEFLTPCFCAGANQTQAELRASAIRGQLHWWFRCLGGTLDEERSIFGSVHGDQPLASTFIVRVTQQPSGGETNWHAKIPHQGTHPIVYLLGFFCGRTGRLNPKGAIPPGSKAKIEIIFRRPPTQRLEQTLRIFFSIGALGFRTTRAAGALTSKEHALTSDSWTALTKELSAAGFQVNLLDKTFGTDWYKLLESAGSFLKDRLRGRNGLGISAGRNGSKPNPLGSANPRQTSVLHLRPVRIDNQLRLALIEAPHTRILGLPALKAHGSNDSIINLLKQKNVLSL